MEINLREKGTLVESLWHSVDGAAGDLALVPGLVHRVIETEAWKERTCRGKTYCNGSFLEFITSKPLKGCGWPPSKVEALLKDDPAILEEWRRATTAPKHLHTDADIVSIKPRHGNDSAYLLGRLKREKPDLFLRVTRKELSVHAAAIEAGFRHKPSALDQIRRLLPKLTEEESDTLADEFLARYRQRKLA